MQVLAVRRRSVRARWTFLSSVLVVLVTAASAQAGTFAGYATTGFEYTNKAECCEDAIFAAQDNAALDCESSGGYPNLRANSARGRCDWATKRGPDGRSVFKCEANVNVPCR